MINQTFAQPSPPNVDNLNYAEGLTPGALNRLDLPLDTPSTQTILPVLTDYRGSIVGWIPIAETEFDGTERTFTTANGPIAITTVTLPEKYTDGHKRYVSQFMAAVYTEDVHYAQPWLGYQDFVPINQCQYALQWFQPTEGARYRLNLGPLFTDLIYGMDMSIAPVPTPPEPPTSQNGTLRWAVSLTQSDLNNNCPFLDFNWVQLFNAEATAAGPLRITTTASPAGGEFKSTLVPYPNILPEGSPEYNTVRIIKLKESPAGDYVFHYTIQDTAGGTTNVVFTLSVV